MSVTRHSKEKVVRSFACREVSLEHLCVESGLDGGHDEIHQKCRLNFPRASAMIPVMCFQCRV